MLRWRLLLGTLIVAALIGLCWLDQQARLTGIWLFPVAAALTLLASGEMLGLARSSGLQPLAAVVYWGNLLIVTAGWLAPLAAGEGMGGTGSLQPDASVHAHFWLVLAFSATVLAAFLGEIGRYETARGVTANLAASVLCLVYIGLLMGLVVSLRMAHGIGALASLLIVVKLSDTGAYSAGRLFGRHPLASRLSPRKTIEGAFGGLALASVGAWATFRWIVPATAPTGMYVQPEWWICLLYGILVGASGMVGDLGESLLKRDAQQKDSSTWLPGFGGVLDLIDSILLAVPMAYVFWAARIAAG